MLARFQRHAHALQVLFRVARPWADHHRRVDAADAQEVAHPMDGNPEPFGHIHAGEVNGAHLLPARLRHPHAPVSIAGVRRWTARLGRRSQCSVERVDRIDKPEPDRISGQMHAPIE